MQFALICMLRTLYYRLRMTRGCRQKGDISERTASETRVIIHTRVLGFLLTLDVIVLTRLAKIFKPLVLK
jgi:hypothetical protein